MEKALGLDHPSVGASLNNLAGLYEATGRAAEALPLRRRCLAIFKEKLPGEHPYVQGAQQSLERLEAALAAGAEPERLAAAPKSGLECAPVEAVADAPRAEETEPRRRLWPARIVLVLLIALALLAGLASTGLMIGLAD
jgi:hypothetical protein